MSSITPLGSAHASPTLDTTVHTPETVPASNSVSDNFDTSPVTPTAAIGATSSLTVVDEPENTAVATVSRDPGFWYNFKQKFWTKIVTMAFSAAKVIPVTKPGKEKLEMVRYSEMNPEIHIDNIYVTSDVPEVEKSKSKEILYAVIRWLSNSFSLHTSTTPPISDDFDEILKVAYPQAYRQLLPAPVIPPEIAARPDDIVGTLALEGPFAAYIEKVSGTDNLFKIDLEKYSGVAVREGLKSLGGTAYLTYDPLEKRMNTVSIRYKGQTYLPSSTEWKAVQKIILCTLSTDMTGIRHLANTHLLVSGTFAGVNTRTLEPNHPLRVLMHPHCHLTLSTNNYKVANLISSENSAFPKAFSFDKATVQNLINDHAATFDIASMDPAVNAQDRGMTGLDFEYPYLSNATSIKGVIDQYVADYIDTYFPNEESLQNDPQIQNWFAELNKYIPNGITHYTPEVTKENVIKLCSMLIQTAAVEHENVGNITWNYTTLQQYIPSLVPLDGSNPPMDVYQRYINTSVLTFIPLNQLMDDYTSIALDEKGAACMNQFRSNLADLQTQMETESEFKYSTMYPKNLECSVST